MSVVRTHELTIALLSAIRRDLGESLVASAVDPKTGELRTEEQNKALFPVRIALCHSELSEALEGDRKNLMDDHLPHRPMSAVELGDAAIRIFDLAGVMGYDLGAIIAEKLSYNASRPDHKHVARNAANGKKY